MSDFADRVADLDPKRLRLLAVELKSRLDALDRERRAPIAVVGIGCRLPGADGPDAAWRVLSDGVDAITEVPPDRYDASALYDPDPDAAGRIATRWGGFLDDVERFDADLFGIAPREASSMDPQQRLLLEVAWAALEDAGQAPDRLAGSTTGVFVGISGGDFHELRLARGRQPADAYWATGAAHSIVAGRLSYALGLQGPSLALDTACSSSLVAVHLAIQSLRAGECSRALAGGVNVILSPTTTMALSRARMMAADGRCKTFDARADGFVRAEGCAVVVLKRLDDALADGDDVLAVLRGSAVNQDGRSNGLSAPNGPAQEAVIRAALADAGADAASIGYVEAHGTGTALGDPIEVRALGAVLCVDRTDPLYVGSIKTNVGHLESAAGVAGLVKTVLAVRAGEIPPHLHFETPSPQIPWEAAPGLQVPTASTPWPSPRLAGVSSFGFGGTNAHVIVGEAPPSEAVPDVSDRAWHLLTLSASGEAGLSATAARLHQSLEESPVAAGDLCHTLGVARAGLACRTAVVVGREDAAERLAEIAAGEAPAGGSRGTVVEARRPRVAFLFTGQGAQSTGMGRELYVSSPTFREALDRCDEILRPRLGISLQALLDPTENDDAGRLDRTEYTQPALVAFEIALAELWRSLGVAPAAVIGHSVGEYAAAHVAGAIELEDTLDLVVRRAALMQSAPGEGAMAAVFAGEAAVLEAIRPYGERLSLAAVNGPRRTTVSGETAALRALLDELTGQGIVSRELTVSHAFHSRQMDPILDGLEAAAASASFAEPGCALVSNLTGRPLSVEELRDPGYWRRHAREPVRFADGVESLVELGCTALIEVGPRPTLLGIAKELVDDAVLLLPSLRADGADWRSMLDSLGRLFVRGADIDWPGVDRGVAPRKRRLPTSSFGGERYPLEAPSAPPVPEAAGIDDLLYEVAWPSAPRAEGAGADPVGVAARAAARLEPVAAAHGLEVYDEALPQLDRLCGATAAEALQGLGLSFEPGALLDVDSTLSQLGIEPRHRRLLARLYAILAEDGVLERASGGWRVVAAPAPVDLEAEWERLRTAYPAAGAEIELTERCARRLQDVLLGRCDPLELLFPGGSLDDAARLYGEAPSARAHNEILAEALAAALPPDRPARILEIGAGTGGTTVAALERLDATAVAEYVFTDVSPLFVERARERFAERPFVTFQTLDITADPAAQGAAQGSFDVIVAANVLHATPDLRSTLARVRSLLVEGGLLILLEATGPTRFGDLTVGLTPGWWAFEDDDLRPDYALLPAARWVELLAAEGFEAPQAVGDEATGPWSRQAVLVARAAGVRPEPAPWLLLADTGGVAEALAAALRDRGEGVTLANDLEQAAGESANVVDLRPLDAGLRPAADPADVEQALRLSAGGPLHLVQALTRSSEPGRGRFWIVTRGAVDAGESAEPGAAVQATAWGLGRVVDLEAPELACIRVDLDPAWSAGAAAEALAGELLAPDAEREVALRGTERRARRVVRAAPGKLPAGVRPRIHGSGWYLVTGGLRGLGLAVAERLVTLGARGIVLAGRREPDAKAAATIEELRRSGAQVLSVQADVARREDVVRVLADGTQAFGALHGIVHAAGAIDDAALAGQTWERLVRACSAKVWGSWWLHELTLDLPVDFFVLFSSGASLVGSPGQANHAAANAFLDALAHGRRGAELPGQSVNWGAWGSIGIAAETGVSRPGLESITPEQGLAALEGLLAAGDEVRQIGVMAVDWERALGGFAPGEEPRALIELRPEIAGPADLGAREPEQPQLLDELAAAPASRRSRLLEEHVRVRSAHVLGLDPSRLTDVDRPLMELGLDSLMAVELRNLLGRDAAEALPATLLFEYPTVRTVAVYIGERLGLATQDVPELADDGGRTPFDDLSTQELAALLAERLDRIS